MTHPFDILSEAARALRGELGAGYLVTADVGVHHREGSFFTASVGIYLDVRPLTQVACFCAQEPELSDAVSIVIRRAREWFAVGMSLGEEGRS